MKLLIFILVSSFFFCQNGLAETENLRDSRSVGIPSLNRMIQASDTAKREQEAKKQQHEFIKKEPKIIQMTNFENELIVQILKQDPSIDGEKKLNGEKNERYHFIELQTANLPMFMSSPEKEEKRNFVKRSWARGLHPEKIDITPLVDSFISRNEMQARLGVKSSKSDGFLIDTENTKNEFFGKKGSGGWQAFYAAHPNSYGISTISIPAYDDKMKLVLVFRSISGGSLYGSGWIFLYSYVNGQLKLLRKDEVWRS